MATADGQSVSGYYTVIAGQLEQRQATAATSGRLSRHFPIPVALLARLAVDQRYQGKGSGPCCSPDALARVRRAPDEIAMRAVAVHAIDDRAAAFYARYGFRSLTATPRTLMVTLAEIRAAELDSD